MEVRRLDPAACAPIVRADAALAIAGLIGGIGHPDFGQRGIEQINGVLPIGWWAVYRLFDDAPPRLHFGGHLNVDDCTADSFAAYRSGLYRRDTIVGLAREQVRGGAAVMTYLHASEMQREHRLRIYTRHGLSERLSLLGTDAAAGMLSINLYRHIGQPSISDDERDCFQQLGPLLLACVARHVALAPASGGGDGLLAALPRREREVCERLLRGWTHDGIAADLQLSATTVKTYRDRAFERLGIHHRNELFALVMQEAGARV